MTEYVYVYVGEKARGNFRIGMDSLTWGWKQPAQGPLAEAATSRLQDPGKDTYLVFAQEIMADITPPGWPRTREGDMSAWQASTINTLTLARISGAMYTAEDRLWPDDNYPSRVGFGSVTQLHDVPAAELKAAALVAVRDSALRQGRPILGPSPLTEDAESAIAPADDHSTSLPDRLLDGLDGLNGLALILMRREQKVMRKKKFGTATVMKCSVCGRELPVGIIRLAHIKRRAEATDQERLNPANTMAACTLGCDELFERGYLTVNEAGSIELSATIKASVDLDVFAGPLAQRRIADYSAETAEFFAWHRASHQSGL